MFLTVGTSAVVYPAAGFVHQARASGAFTAEINMDETPASALVDLSLRGPAEEILPAIEQLLASGDRVSDLGFGIWVLGFNIA